MTLGKHWVLGTVAALMTAAPVASEAAECGVASWYRGSKRGGGADMTAAHRTLPFGTKVVVRNAKNGREVTVRINDRGPFIRGRVIDVSQPASKALAMDGIAKVCLTVAKADGQPATAPAAKPQPLPAITGSVTTAPTIIPPLPTPGLRVRKEAAAERKGS